MIAGTPVWSCKGLRGRPSSGSGVIVLLAHSRFSSASSASSAVDSEPLSRKNRGGRRGRRGLLAGNTLIPHYPSSAREV